MSAVLACGDKQGSHTGWNRHARARREARAAGQPVPEFCQPCNDARADYMQHYRQETGQTTAGVTRMSRRRRERFAEARRARAARLRGAA